MTRCGKCCGLRTELIHTDGSRSAALIEAKLFGLLADPGVRTMAKSLIDSLAQISHPLEALLVFSICPHAEAGQMLLWYVPEPKSRRGHAAHGCQGCLRSQRVVVEFTARIVQRD